MKIFKRITAVLLALLLCFSAVGCASDSDATEKVDTKRYDDVSYKSDITASGVVYENDLWQVNWDDVNKRVSFTEKATGAVWGSAPAQAIADADAKGGIVHPQMDSAIHVYFHDPTNVAEDMSMSHLGAVQDGEIYAIKLDNGIRVVYNYMALEFMVPVDYTLEGNHFSISVDPTEIADNGKNYVTAVSIAPFMCSAKSGAQDSWLLMPDGSGSLIRPTDLSSVAMTGQARIYGEDLTIQTYEFNSVTEQIYMPVYGAKRGDNALFAIIESGDEAASLAWSVGDVNLGYSTLYTRFDIRGYTRVTPPRGFSTPASHIKVFTHYICPTKLKISYYGLSGEKASLTGMADTYREYLLNKGLLIKSEADEKSASFKYIGGTVQPDFFVGLPTSKLFPMTTTDQAAQMTKEISEKLGNDFYVDLVGFGSSGVDIGKYAGNFTVAKELGGVKGMNNLSATMSELGLPWYMDFDLVTLTKGSNGFSKNSDTALWHNQQVAYFYTYNTMTRNNFPERYNIFARAKLGDAADKLVEKAADLKLQGISLDSLSHVIYSDYVDASTQVANGMVADATNVFSTVKKGGYGFLADSANIYAAGVADSVIGAPLYSSNYDFSTDDVPFYQMVLRGYIPMSSQAINLCSMEKDALLRCVEAGIAPSYTFTYNYDNELVSSQHAFIYGSSYSGNRDRALEAVASVKDYLNSIEGASIVQHASLAEGVRMTKFSNGVQVVVNFSEVDFTTDNGTVVAAGNWEVL